MKTIPCSLRRRGLPARDPLPCLSQGRGLKTGQPWGCLGWRKLHRGGCSSPRQEDSAAQCALGKLNHGAAQEPWSRRDCLGLPGGGDSHPGWVSTAGKGNPGRDQHGQWQRGLGSPGAGVVWRGGTQRSGEEPGSGVNALPTVHLHPMGHRELGVTHSAQCWGRRPLPLHQTL